MTNLRPAALRRIAFLSDFGIEDEFVGVVHAVLDRHAPGVRVIDVTHGIRPHDVRGGSLTLWRAAPWLSPGVILAVVDPGVGTERRAVALEVARAGTALVGPDNGLLLPAALRLGPITAAVELRPPPDPPVAWPVGGATFAGRDLFAPAAARLAAGVPLSHLGPGIDPGGLHGEAAPEPAVAGGEVDTEVLWIDRFGNAQLNAVPHHLDGPSVRVTVAGRPPFTARVVSSYGAIAPDQVALVVDSYGLLSICADRASASRLLDLRDGQMVRLSRIEAPSR